MSKWSKVLSMSLRVASWVELGLAVINFKAGDTSHGITRILFAVTLSVLAGYESIRADYRDRLRQERNARLLEQVPRIAGRIGGDR